MRQKHQHKKCAKLLYTSNNSNLSDTTISLDSMCSILPSLIIDSKFAPWALAHPSVLIGFVLNHKINRPLAYFPPHMSIVGRALCQQLLFVRLTTIHVKQFCTILRGRGVLYHFFLVVNIC